MSVDDQNPQQPRLADLLALAGRDAAPPDEGFLQRLREQSAEAFVRRGEPAPPDASAKDADGEAGRLGTDPSILRENRASPELASRPIRTRRSRMFVFAVRTLAAGLAASLVAALALLNGPKGDSALALDEAIRKTAAAQTLHLRITRDGKTNDVFARRPQQLHWKNPDGTYRVVHGSRMWLVDEKANRATSQPAAYFADKESGVDLAALVSLRAGDRKEWSQLKPAEQVQAGGRACYVYRWSWPVEGGKQHLEALVDAGTQFLYSLELKGERNGRLEPLRKLEVVSLNQPVDESLFVVGDTLTEDGRIGKVLDLQGVVAVKPVMGQRWTPVDAAILIHPGDWIRTDVRGANAVRARLVKDTLMTLGPGSLAELVSPRQVRLSAGEIKIAAGKTPIELLGPGDQKLSVRGTEFYRVDGEKLVRVPKEPPWVTHFEGRTSQESIGSLVAKVEGRNVPLVVGYHKVTVDIRDQIARTVIEESFVNHTAGTLEGVFYFPLPADASISGFGMWIGDKLVEADIVEKQRAREIYETILRERRDPGLLEWTGGNIFKARVFPIFGHSEKRIKISYTQALARQGNRYRYQYALQSEMLRQHPLRELSIDVKLSSVAPLASVTSPTHPARIDKTAHSARVEFSAQEYTPPRDFEIVVETGTGTPEVVLIPHRRGDDGYFMVQLGAPGDAGAWQRELLPDGEPLDLVILADTSASIDAAARTAQQQFVAAVLAALTPRDKFNLAVCDVDAHWAFAESRPADPKSVAQARGMLAERVSLGWTDLDKAMAAALAKAGPKTRVIYVGDGIHTAGDGDPVALGKRLHRMYREQYAAGVSGPSFHAVAVSASYEQVVLKALASLGGGSTRRITASSGPQTAARELLEEMVLPSIRDLKVEFRGLRAARVYPEQLPNLATGSQQILLGRYLPEGKDQAGEVIVTGTRQGHPVRFSTRVSLKDAEQGNSFIPRLWARMHLDFLLGQGASPAIQDEIIALSEEYNIITPYTSMLVLESDADRERFKVKTRFRMRDGEKFFAEGRDNVDYELTQQQMRRAAGWRIGLRRAVLQQLQTLGRYHERHGGMIASGGYGGRLGWKASGIPTSSRSEMTVPGISGEFYDTDGDSRGDLFAADFNGRMPEKGEISAEPAPALPQEAAEQEASAEEAEKDQKQLQDTDESDAAGDRAGGEVAYDREEPSRLDSTLGQPLAFHDSSEVVDSLRRRRASSVSGYYLFAESKPMQQPMRGLYYGGWAGDYSPGYPAGQWLSQFCPALAPAPRKGDCPDFRVNENGTVPFCALPKRWPPEARKVAESLLRTGHVAGLTHGLRILKRTESIDPRWNEVTHQSETLSLVSPSSWLVRSTGDNSQTLLQWCDARERGILSSTYGLERVRASTAEDQRRAPLGLEGFVLDSMERTYWNYTVELKPQGQDRLLLVMGLPSSPEHQTHVLVDTQRHVVLLVEHRRQGKVTSATRYGDFVEVAGAWYSGRIETLNEENQSVAVVTQKFEPLAAGQFGAGWKAELALRERALVLREPLPSVTRAKRAVAAGKATFEDHLVLMLHFEQSQQWNRVLAHLEQAERLVADKPGVRWIRTALLDAARRRQQWKDRVFDEAARLARDVAAAMPASDAHVIAEYLFNQARHGVNSWATSDANLEHNEILRLLDVLRPVYERQPPRVKGMKRWTERRAEELQRTGQGESSLALRKQLAQDYPREADAQRQYAQALMTAGEYEAARAWIDRVLKPEARWRPSEEESLRNVVTELLRQQGWYPELAEYLAAWIQQGPNVQGPYRQYLSALVYTDRLDQANATLGQWLKEGQKPEPLPPAAEHRLRAAVQQALGQGYYLSTDRIEPLWQDRLAEAALFFARHDAHLDVAGQIMTHWRFQQTDAGQRVRAELARLLRRDAEKLSAQQIQQFVSWCLYGSAKVQPEAWKEIAARLRQRWSAEPQPEIRRQIGSALAQVLGGRVSAEARVEFLRDQLREAPPQYRTDYVQKLFEALLREPWKAEQEDEMFVLLPQLSDADDPADRLSVQASALREMTDRMVQARFDARMQAIPHQEKLTRTELAAKRAENLRLAREGYADQLRVQIAKAAEGDCPDFRVNENGTVPFCARLAPWMNVERLYLEIQAGRNLAKVAEQCWEFLGPPQNFPAAYDGSILHDRYHAMLMNLAARKTADPAMAGRLLAYLDRAIAKEPEESHWKLAKVQLLIALDRPKDIEKDLRSWIAGGDPDNRWRHALAYLAAEQGRLQEAITLLERIRDEDELGPTDHRALANWYMAVGRREDYRRAMIAVYKTVEDWRLNNWLWRKLEPWRRHGGDRPGSPMPAELDKEVLLAFAALLEKSSQPQQYFWQLREYYGQTRDFRLLAGLADAMVGHTAGRVYPMLEQTGTVLAEVQDEATADALVEQIDQVRKRAKTAVDERALDLLEVLVQRRAAELKNQPGPHAERALAALRRAFKRQWSPGEQRLMADVLANLGNITHPALAEEQVRQLESLHAGASMGSIDRLHIAHALARAHAHYGRRPRGIDLLKSALAEYLPAVGSMLPAEANGAVETLVGFLEAERHFAQGETVLQDYLKRPANRQQSSWLLQRLYRLYSIAIANNGEVSLGSGLALYRAVNRKLQAELDTPDDNHRYQLIQQLLTVYREGHSKKFEGMAEDLRRFAFQRLPEVLKRQTNQYQSIVLETARRLRDTLGPRQGLAFLVERMENEPAWFRLNNQDGWSQFSYTMAEWRTGAGDLGDLGPRLLAIVLKELRKDLQSRQWRNRSMYHADYQYFWSENVAAFARVADEVAAERKDSSDTLVHVADYLYRGLHRHAPAIAILLDADRREVLDEHGKLTLVRFLHEQGRHAESIPILEPLVLRRPENIEYRTRLMHAYFRTGQREKLLALLQQTDAFFHQDHRWQEPILAALAYSCLENHLYTQSVAYYNELIPLHQRTQPRRGIGNGTLSKYYQDLAQAYIGLGKTIEAVDAACGAIVSWGPRHSQRASALENLKRILAAAKDLDALVGHLDRQAAESGLHNPIVRKAIGQVYQEKNQWAKAIPQLKLATELQPNDAEIYAALVSCYDKLGDRPGAVEQLLRSLEFRRRDTAAWRDLAERYRAMGTPAEAERAYTSMVEMLPSESESHAALAEVRQSQNRWDEAVVQWEQVARIRALEPTGLLKLAEALVHLKRWDDAQAALDKLRARSWPARFGDVRGQARNLEFRLDELRKKPAGGGP